MSIRRVVVIVLSILSIMTMGACFSTDEIVSGAVEVKPQFLLGGCPPADPDCDERSPTPDELQDMENAIRARNDCPEIRSLLLGNLTNLMIMQDDGSPMGWTLGDATSFTIWVHENHWGVWEFPDELIETMYHEGAHAFVGSWHQHDSVWQNAFSCYSS